MIKKQDTLALTELRKKVELALTIALTEHLGEPLTVKFIASTINSELLLPEEAGAHLFQVNLRIQVSPKPKKLLADAA